MLFRKRSKCRFVVFDDRFHLRKVMVDYKTGDELFVEPSKEVAYVLMALSIGSVCACVVKLWLILLTNRQNILQLIVLLQPIEMAIKTSLVLS